MEIERRFFPIAELRTTVGTTTPQRIIGHAAVFNSPSETLGHFKEIVAPGAFKSSIASDDIRALLNHSPMHVLGRNRAGTLSLHEDSVGLVAEITPPDTTWAPISSRASSAVISRR